MADDIVGKLLNAAKLSRLDMSCEELEALAPKALAIFAAFDKLSQLDTQNIEPLYGFRESIDLRADEARSGLNPDELLKGAPGAISGHFVVPRVVGGDDVF